MKASCVVVVSDGFDVASQATRRLGCPVGVASSLLEGLELARSTVPVVVLLDAYLPDGDGVAAIGEFLDLAPPPLVVLVGDQVDDVAADAALAAGAGAAFSTPRLDEAIDLIDDLVTAAQMGVPLPSLRPSLHWIRKPMMKVHPDSPLRRAVLH